MPPNRTLSFIVFYFLPYDIDLGQTHTKQSLHEFWWQDIKIHQHVMARRSKISAKQNPTAGGRGWPMFLMERKA